ncbi:amidohydrolase family protein [Streptomyces sp. NPDC093223]|uniref:amidohydrolase family protein n=1 Tax=Streptomyces sp. NPDC093223 TaxID=3366033 RepID=UPI003823C9F4
MRVDVHAHYFPAAYLDLLKAYGSRRTDIARIPCAGDADGDIDARLRMMDAAGVDLQILSATPQMPYLEDAGNAVAAARFVNDRYAELVAAHPARFAALAAAPLPHTGEAVEETVRALDDLGFVGAAVSTTVLGRTLGDPAFEAYWAALDERSAPVFVHAAGRDLDSPQIADHGLTWIVGAPFEDAVGVLHLLRAGVTARYPNIKFVVPHLGGGLSFLLQRIDDNFLHYHEAFPDVPSTLLRRMWFDTVGAHAPALRETVESFGADRVLLGSDFPYFQGDLYTRAVRYVGEAGLPAEQVHAVLDGNVHDVFDLS